MDPDERWEEFVEEYGQDWTEHTRKYQYGKGWREWISYCSEIDIHPLAPTPEQVEEHLSKQREEASTDATLHQTRFRPLCRLFEWLRYHTDSPVRYNPWIMAVLLDADASAAWRSRISSRITH